MIFSSPEFVFLFLPIVAAVFVAARRCASLSAAIAALGCASVVFYGIWKPVFIPILLGSVVWNFGISQWMTRKETAARSLLVIGIGGDLGLLFWFKYAAFVSQIGVQVGVLGSALAELTLPLGISFFTFQQIAYLVDRYQGKAPPTSLVRYLLFVCFFPQLIAGPIVHHGEMMPQFRKPDICWSNISLGLFIFAIGFAKKVVIADSVGVLADSGFGDVMSLSAAGAWAVVAAYTVQLYFDFSGYCDMAVGLGLLFGIKLPWNFRSPYKCTNIASFWRRWHVTLSRFLRDYVYIPLGGSRGSGSRTSVNLFVTLLLGGIWHGAGWTFILWGALHGVAVAAYHGTKSWRKPMPWPLAWLATFTFVSFAWVLFRAETLADAMHVYQAMCGFTDAAFRVDGTLLNAAPFVVLGLVVSLLMPNCAQLADRYKPTLLWAVVGGLVMAAAIFFMLGQISAPEFIYYDF